MTVNYFWRQDAAYPMVNDYEHLLCSVSWKTMTGTQLKSWQR